MSKIDSTTIEQEADWIKGRYDYMDQFESLDCWIWEFTRRTESYKSLFADIVRQKDRIINDLIGMNTGPTEMEMAQLDKLEEVSDSFEDDPIGKARKLGISSKTLLKLGVRDEDIEKGCWPTDIYQFDDHMVPKELFELVKNLRDFHMALVPMGEGSLNDPNFIAFPIVNLGLPSPDSAYNQFSDDLRPRIIGIAPVVHYTFESLKKHCVANLDRYFWYASDLRNKIADLAADPFTIMDNENTLFIGISRTGKRDHIKEQIGDIVDKYVKSPRTKPQTSKWKRYLMVYDLDKKGYGIRMISEILLSAYPEQGLALDEKNIENALKEIILLIDRKKYMKYLLSS